MPVYNLTLYDLNLFNWGNSKLCRGILVYASSMSYSLLNYSFCFVQFILFWSLESQDAGYFQAPLPQIMGVVSATIHLGGN